MLKRPKFFNFLVIDNGSTISLRGTLLYLTKKHYFIDQAMMFDPHGSSPKQNLWQLKKDEFQLKLVAFGKSEQKLYEKVVDSDSFGHFRLSLPSYVQETKVEYLQLYEVSEFPGLELYIGSYIPEQIETRPPIVITDFDKTLVHTTYSTAKEMYYSITQPLSEYPSLEPSINIFKRYINQNYIPFVLSASPHFYEDAIVDWLYQNQIYTNHLFLKDFRRALSPFKGELTLKDIHTQGFYKLNQLVDILLICGGASKLCLMGDGFESDMTVYLTLRSLLIEKIDPLYIWKRIRNLDSFKLNKKQQSTFLNKLYQLQSLREPIVQPFEIYIRCPEERLEEIQSKVLPSPFLNDQKSNIVFYTA